MRGGWGLYALGKFFRRRHRRRRPRPPGVGAQAAFDFLNYDFGVSGMRGWIRLVKRAPNNEIRAKVD